MLRIRSGSPAPPNLLGAALLIVVAVGPWGCGAPSPRRSGFTPVDEARHRAEVLRARGGTLTPDQVALIERIPYRSSGPSDIPRALEEGIPEPRVPLGERRSLLEMVRGDEGDGAPTEAVSQTGEDPDGDPKR